MGLESSVSVVIRGKDLASAALNKINKSLRTFATTAKRAFTEIGKSAQKLNSLTGALAALGIVAGVRGVIGVMGRFQRSMSQVQAVTGATAEGFADLTEEARRLGATTRFTATEAAAGMAFLGRAGFDTAEILGSMEANLDLAAAGMLDLARAADITSNIMSAFQISARESSRVADSLAFTAASANTNVEQMGEAMKFVGPVASALGVSLEDTAAAIGILGNAGIQATLAGTSLRRVMSALIIPTKEAQRALSSLGLTAEEISPETNSLVEIIKTLDEAGLGAAEAMQIFGLRGGPAILALTANSADLEKLTEEVNNSGGAAKKMAQIMEDNLVGSSIKLKSAIEEIIQVIGEQGLISTLTLVTDSLTGAARVVGKLADDNGILLNSFVAVAAVVAGGTVLLTGIGLVTTLLAALSPIVLAVAAGLAIVAALFTAGATATTSFLVEAEKTKEEMLDLARAIEEVNSGATQLNAVEFTAIGKDELVSGLKEQLEALIDAGQTASSAAVEAVQNSLDELSGKAEVLRKIQAERAAEEAKEAAILLEQEQALELQLLDLGVAREEEASAAKAAMLEADQAQELELLNLIDAAEVAMEEKRTARLEERMLVQDDFRIRDLESRGLAAEADREALLIKQEEELGLFLDTEASKDEISQLMSIQARERAKLETKQKAAEWAEQLRTARITMAGIGAFSTALTNVLGKNSKVAIIANKAAAAGNAILNTAEGVTKAMTLPFPLNFVVAAAVAASGIAQLAVIAGVGGGGGGGGGAPAPTGPAGFGPGFERGGPIVPIETEENQRAQVTINIEGNNVDQIEFGRTMKETLRDLEIEEI